MSNPWVPSNHGITSDSITPPEASVNNTANSTDSKTIMVPSSSPPTIPGPPIGNSKGPEKGSIVQRQTQPQGADSMVHVQQQHQQQHAVGPLQHPHSASVSSTASFHAGPPGMVPHPVNHPTHHHSMGPMGANNHIPPQYGHPNHHHSHIQSHQIRHGEHMMGAIRSQGHPHPHGQHIQNNNYHQPGLVRPAGRYPIQHSLRGGDGYGQNMHMHGHVQHGRPGHVSNYHHQQHPQYHTFQPQGPHVTPGPSASGMEQVSSRGPSPSHLQQSQPHSQKPQTNAPPAGVAVAISQSQPLRRVSTSENMNKAAGANYGEPHEDPNQARNCGGQTGLHHSKQQPAMQPLQQQKHGPGQGQPIPHVRQDHDLGLQEHHRNHTGPSTMHQRYPGHHHQHQAPLHDPHYGGQPSVHHGGHPNGIHTDMHHYNYHHPSQVGAGLPPIHNHFHGHPENGISAGYRGHREMYPHSNTQNHFQHHQHNPNGFGQPLSHPPPQQRPPGHGFQIPKYNASRTTVNAAAAENKAESTQPMSRSPSPPPSPPPAPSAQALLRQKLREQDAKKNKEQPSTASISAGEENSSLGKKSSDSMSISDNSIRRNSSGSHASNNGSKPTALGDRGNVAAAAPSAAPKWPVTESTNKTVKQEDITADAASILLQLGSVMNRSTGGSENQNPSGHSAPPIPTSVQHSTSMDDVSDAGTMLTMQTEAPDLTSEPSTDSIDSEPNISASVSKSMTGPTSSSVPKQVAETDFPCAVPDRYPTRLALPYDNAKLNTLHCFLRSELLEIFVVSKSHKKSPCHSPSSSVGRVGLRCVHCAMMRGSRREDREDAPMAVFYPKSIAEIYRLVTSWQRCHLRKCKNVPPAARARWQTLRETDRSRGKTHYWVTSAKQIGLMDCQSRAGGIRFVPDFDPRTLPAETKLTPSSKEAAAKAAAIAAKAQKIVSIANAAAASNMAVVPENAEMTDVSKKPNSVVTF